MGTLAALSLNDGQATPVAHTFAPAGGGTNPVMYEDRAIGIPIGYNRVSLSLRPPVRQKNGVATGMYKATLTVDVPVLEVTSPTTGSGIQPAPTLSYEQRVKVVFMLPERSTLANRNDLLAFLINLLNNSAVKTDLIGKYELPY